MKTPTTPRLCKFLVAFLLAVPMLLPAANLTWDANTTTTGSQDGSGTWDNTAANWWNGTADVVWSGVTPDAALFGSGGAAGTVTLGANIVSGNITFNAGGVGNYAIAGGGFQLGLTNRTIFVSSSATINSDITGTAPILYHSGANAPYGTLTLGGNNTFTGGFTIGPNDGGSAPNTTAAVRATSGNAFGTGTITFNQQGSLTSPRLEVTGGITITNAIAATGRNNPSAAVVALSGANVLSGTFTRGAGGADFSIATEAANGLTLSGATGTGGVALGSAAGFPRNYILRGTGSGTVSGIIATGTGANNLGIVKAGSGTWTLSGANTFTNGTIVDGGTLTLDYSSQNNSKLPDVGPLTLGGGTLNLSGGSHTEVVVSTTIGAGNSSITRSSGTSTLRMNAITRNRGGVVDFGAASIADTDALNVNGILGGYATVAGSDWAMNSTGGADGAVTAYSSYTDVAATGSTIADGATTNVRLNSAGGGGNVALGATTTTVQTLLQNTTTAATIDTASKTLRLGTNGGLLVPSGKQAVTIGTAANSGTLTAGGSDNTQGEIILINNSANAVTVNSVVADNGTGPVSLTKAGSGSATLAGSNTHTGTNSIVGGTLNVSDDSNFGAVPGAATIGKILINGGSLNATASFTLNANRGIALGPTSRYGNGTISVDSGQTLTYSGIIANADTTGNGPGGSLTKTGPGTLVVGTANTYTLGTILNSGTLSISASASIGAQPGCYIPDHLVVNGGTLEATATLTLGSQRGIMLGAIGGSGTGTFLVDSGFSLQLDSRIADNWNGTGSLTKTGDGTLIITSPFNDYSGDTTVSAGTLQINNARSIPNGTGKGNLSLATGTTLNLNGVSASLNGLSGSGFVDNATGTAMTFSVGNNNQTSSFSGSIQNTGGGPLALSKAGNGTLTLANNNINHTGSTLITGGTLALSGSATMGNTTNIVVSSGATFDVSGLTGGTLALNSGQTLSGNGTVLGTINVGAGAMAPGASAGTLNVANLTLSSGSVLNYELANVTTAGAGVNDYTVVSGTLNVAGPTTLNLSYLNGIPASSGKYTLISYASGTFSGNVNDISVPSGFTISNNVVSKTIELLINHIPNTLTWRGDGAANVWDLNTTFDWTPTGSPLLLTNFFNGDSVAFDNSGSNSPSIAIDGGGVQPGAVVVNASQNYDFSGGAISSTTLTKSGGGTLTLENDNTYFGGATISAGTLQIGNATASGTLAGGNITNNAALVFDRTDTFGVTSPISGSGTVTQIGTGSVGLSGSNSYAGLTTLVAGSLFVQNGSSLGLTNTGTVVDSGAVLYITANVNVGNEPLTISGSGPTSTEGALRKGGAGTTIYGGAVTLLADSMINLDGGATLNLTNADGIVSGGQNLTVTGGGNTTVSGPVNLGGGLGVLTKTGGGALTLAGANSMSLATVANGTLILANNNALGTNLNVVLTSTTGGAGISGTRLTLSGGLTIPANRTLAMTSSGAGTIRTAFVGTGAGLTNIWNGPVSLTGDSSASGNVINWGADANSTFVINGNVTSDSTFLGGKLLVRGNATGTGILAGAVTLDPANGMFQIDDGSTWILNSSANTWLTTIFAGSSTIRLGANNALPTATLLTIGNGAANRLDLSGFNQQVAGLEMGPGLNITNSSTSADSTLTYSSSGTSTYGGTISDGTRRLNLTIAAGTLQLTNPATLNLTKSTLSIAGGGPVLQLTYVGTNTLNALVLNGVSQPAGLYNSVTSPLYIAGTGYLLVQPIAYNSTNITFNLTGGTLALSWPPDHLGWTVQSNSVNIANTNSWFDIAGSQSATNLNITITPAQPQVFFRLRHSVP